MRSTNALRRPSSALHGVLVLAVIVPFALLACQPTSPAPSLERSCGRAFEQQVMLELRDVKDSLVLDEQRRLLDSIRQASITACVERADAAGARCAADAQSLDALVACRGPRNSITH